ncbi:MAG: hypothetical protein IKZ87_03955 [Actinomycetaceae bacterium]|nr:hypothetical protein [Actinomycetaceae bacterium]
MPKKLIINTPARFSVKRRKSGKVVRKRFFDKQHADGYSVSPYFADSDIKEKKSRKWIKDTGFTNDNNSKIIHADYEEKTYAAGCFVKVHFDALHELRLECKISELTYALFNAAMSIYQNTKMHNGYVEYFDLEYDDVSDIMSETAYRECLQKLIDLNVFAVSNKVARFFVNPKYAFKGDQIACCRDIKKIQRKSIPEAAA